jgi:hypothetical protein
VIKDVPHSLLAVDPGKRGCGVAWFIRGILSKAAFVKGSLKGGNDLVLAQNTAQAVAEWYRKATFAQLNVFVCEWPKVYADASLKRENPNDLLPLAGVNVAIAAMLARDWFPVPAFVTYEPRAWKGSIKKEAMTARIPKHLEPFELEWIEHVGAKDHNTIDAIGIGLKYLGRLERKRVYAR